MKRKAIFGLVWIGVFTFILAGCGNSLDKPGGPEGTITSAMAATFAGSSGQNAIDYGNPFNKELSNGLTEGSFGRAGRTEDGCTATPSSTTDADGDGIPANSTYTFTCNFSGMELNVSGSMTMQDKNDAVVFPKSGFLFTIDSLNMNGSFDGASLQIEMNANFDLEVSGTTATSTLAVYSTMSAAGQNIEMGVWEDTTVTADNADDPDQSGSMTLSGFVKAVGEGTDYVVQIASSGLTYGCEKRTQFFNNGSITFTDGSSNVIKVTFESCNSGTWTYNDEALSVVRK